MMGQHESSSPLSRTTYYIVMMSSISLITSLIFSFSLMGQCESSSPLSYNRINSRLHDVFNLLSNKKLYLFSIQPLITNYSMEDGLISNGSMNYPLLLLSLTTEFSQVFYNNKSYQKENLFFLLFFFFFFLLLP